MSNSFKLKKGQFRLDIWKKFFTILVVKHWHRSPKEVVDAPSLSTAQGSEPHYLVEDVSAHGGGGGWGGIHGL